MIVRIIISILLIITTITLQTTFWGNSSSLGGDFLSNVNIVMIILVLLVNLTTPRVSIGFSLVIGWLLDIYSTLPFGVFMLLLLVVTIILNILLLSFFTNRSLYSILILGIIGVVSYHILFLTIVGSMFILGWSNFFIMSGYFTAVIWQIISSIIFLIIGFWLVNILSHRFKPIFLHS